MSGLEEYMRRGLLDEDDYLKILKKLDKEVNEETKESDAKCIELLNKLGYSF